MGGGLHRSWCRAYDDCVLTLHGVHEVAERSYRRVCCRRDAAYYSHRMSDLDNACFLIILDDAYRSLILKVVPELSRGVGILSYLILHAAEPCLLYRFLCKRLCVFIYDPRCRKDKLIHVLLIIIPDLFKGCP